MSAPVADQAVRDRALDTSTSFIVQAPAGSGKTELLTRRILALLAVVETPEEVLAITFTRKAAAEMRERVVASLQKAAADAFGDRDDPQKRRLATAALTRSRERGWELDQNPARLRISTIDGLNAMLAARLPWLTRLGGQPGVVEDTRELYGRAADRALRHLDAGDRHAKALKVVLGHLDNRADTLRQSLSALLGKRDQWLRKRGALGQPEDLKPFLEGSLAEILTGRLEKARKILLPYLPEMIELSRFAAANLDGREPPVPHGETLQARAEEVARWRALVDYFLTKAGKARSRPDKSCGWPQGCDADKKERMQALLALLSADEAATKALFGLSKLPDATYSDEEWRIVAPAILAADLAFACLLLEFKKRREVDFTETALRAREALGALGEPSELMLALDRRIGHILIDEFQDTSKMQFDLLALLTQGWSEGDGRTLFIVGDPMQSIYRFREADVTLFARTRREGVGGAKPEALRLLVNFRSTAQMVAWHNEAFGKVFPAEGDEMGGFVPYSPSVAFDGGQVPGAAARFRPVLPGDRAGEAAEVVEEALTALADGEKETVGILVRARTHVAAIVEELNRRGVAYVGEKLDPLSGRQPVKDVVSLAKALADPADRVSWLAALRAPWCALTLKDAHALAGGDVRPIPELVPEALAGARLSEEGQARLSRFWAIAGPALGEVGRRPFRNLVEGVWALLGAPAWLAEQERRDAEAAFSLLESGSKSQLPDLSGLSAALAGLYSTLLSDDKRRLHVMTMHNAKGLEFDTVLLPGLGRKPKQDERGLLDWEETPGGGLLVGGKPEVKGGAAKGVSDLLMEISREKERFERTRLLYVAATRARKRLVMWGEAGWNKDAGWKPVGGSLLEVLWPAVSIEFAGLEKPEAEESGEPDFSRKPVFIEALPGGWRPPELKAPEIKKPGSDSEKDEEEVTFDWAREERKLIGTVAHMLFDRIGEEGLAAWPLKRLEGEKGGIRAKLAELGVPESRLDFAAAGVLGAAEGLLRDERRKWLFNPAWESVTELSLGAVVGDRVVTRRIDRSFVDGEGVRWIVDFKVTPHEGGDLEGFLSAQKERYRPQLVEYAGLFARLEPARKIRAAIYYPLLARLVEVEV